MPQLATPVRSREWLEGLSAFANSHNDFEKLHQEFGTYQILEAYQISLAREAERSKLRQVDACKKNSLENWL